MTKLKVLISKPFWDDALIRAIRTFFQAALAFIGIDIISIVEIDYTGAAAIGAGAAVLSIAQSVIRVATQKIDEDPFDAAEEIAEIEDEEILNEAISEAVQDKMEK